MTIDKQLNGSELCVTVSGRLDTVTAPELDVLLKTSLDDVTSLSLDLANLEYISSAGLRVLMSAQKRMNTQGSMKIKNVNETVMEVFEITGFTGILTIE